MKKKAVLIGLVCLFLVSGGIWLITHQAEQEESVLPEPPDGQAVVGKPAEKPSEKPVESTPQVIEITIAQFFKEYDSNSQRTEEKYAGKTLRLKGKMFENGRGFNGPYVIISDSTPRSGFPEAFCELRDEAEAAALSLIAVNQEVVIQGEYYGTTLTGLLWLKNSFMVK